MQEFVQTHVFSSELGCRDFAPQILGAREKSLTHAYAYVQVRGHRTVYLQYSRFWLDQPADEFSAFLSRLRDEKSDDEPSELSAFDAQLAQVCI